MAIVKCVECGKEKSDAAKTCPHCGFAELQNRTNAFAIAGFISSFFFSTLGLVLSIIGLIQINHSKEQGKGLAIAGIIISAGLMLIGFFIFVLFIVALSADPTLVD